MKTIKIFRDTLLFFLLAMQGVAQTLKEVQRKAIAEFDWMGNIGQTFWKCV